MMHVYFHVTNTERVIIDPKGLEVEDFTDARRQAERVIRELVLHRDDENWHIWILHMSDDQGEDFFMMPFSEILGKLH